MRLVRGTSFEFEDSPAQASVACWCQSNRENPNIVLAGIKHQFDFSPSMIFAKEIILRATIDSGRHRQFSDLNYLKIALICAAVTRSSRHLISSHFLKCLCSWKVLVQLMHQTQCDLLSLLLMTTSTTNLWLFFLLVVQSLLLLLLVLLLLP